jgi:membrane protein implicated in regulation of membrane protease activity
MNLDNIFLLCAMLFGFLSFLILSQLLVMIWNRVTRRVRMRGRVRNSASYTTTR